MATPVLPDVPEPTAPAEAEGVGQTPVAIASEAESIVGSRPAPTPDRDVKAEAFLDGYRAGGGDPAWEEHLIDVIECESRWILDPPGIHYGLAQFAPGTWGQARCSPEADYRDPWEQGCAVARWMAMIPGRWGTTAGWPRCWHVWN